MEVYLHLQRAQHSFDNIKGVPSLRGLFKRYRVWRRRSLMVLLAYSFKLPPPLGTPSYPRGRVVYLVFEDGGVQNISRIKIYRTAIISRCKIECNDCLSWSSASGGAIIQKENRKQLIINNLRFFFVLEAGLNDGFQRVLMTLVSIYFSINWICLNFIDFL